MPDEVWLRESACCHAEARPVIFDNPAAAAYGVNNRYRCAKCSLPCLAIEVKAGVGKKPSQKTRKQGA